MALRPHIADLQHRMTVELLLHVEVVVFHVGRLDVAVEGERIALVGTGGRCRVDWAARSDWSADYAGGKDRVRANVVVGRARIEVRRVGKVAERHVLGERIVEHAKSGTNHGLSFTSYVPGSADARGEILLVRIVKTAQARLSNLRQRERSTGGIQVRNVAEEVVLLLHDSEIVPAQTVVEGQVRGRAEAILNIKTEVVFKGVASRIAEVLESAVDVSRQEILQGTVGDIRYRIGVSAELNPAAEVFIEVLLNGGPVKIDAGLHVVLADLPRKVIDDLVIAVETMAGHAAGGTELCKATDQCNREARVEWRGAIALRSAGRGAQPDGTRMEALVRREETFREAVPTVA